MNCKTCGIKLTGLNRWQSISNKSICNKCNDEKAKSWIKKHPERRKEIQKHFFDKKLVNAIMGKNFNANRFNFLSADRLQFLFDNILWKDDNLNLDKWSIENE